jgi:hypothetical protein
MKRASSRRRGRTARGSFSSTPRSYTIIVRSRLSCLHLQQPK